VPAVLRGHRGGWSDGATGTPWPSLPAASIRDALGANRAKVLRRAEGGGSRAPAKTPKAVLAEKNKNTVQKLAA
jgi:hypothetical protein